ncbi:MAG: hypothetical protein PHH91_13595 [Desulfuromonadaceae bacterium]|nr:hypothetical protein [Desulfuromonadaceae bacterium]
MNATTTVIESRENMILKMIRNFNAAVVKFIMGIRFRAVGAVLLASFAGLSLTSNVIPSAISMMGLMDSFSARWGMGGFAVYSMMAWAVGGWAVQKTGDKKLGAIVLGSVGLTTGLLFTGVGIGTDMNILLTGGGAALLYGAIGGMIIGDALRNPPSDPNDPYASIGRIGDLSMFGYFKKNIQ